MNRLPSGTVTFLFTDIEGSTKLWEKYPEEMKSALAKHDSILKDAVESNNGQIIKTTGDGIHAVFTTAIDAIKASLAAQRGFQTFAFFAKRPDEGKNVGVSIRVRIGLHTGEAELRDEDYYGGTLNRAARIMSVGNGGQILISETTLQVAREHLPADISTRDLGQHHLKGLNRAEHIYQLNAPDLIQEFPALKSLMRATNNLPTQLTSFIGRERELAEARSRLEGAHLLTLIGPGGTGKTRLSLQLGEDLLPAFADGVWLVELAPLADPALILETIASVFDLRAQIGMPLMDIVLNYLRIKQLLLIFDNCEHLIEACAQVADQFLHASPNMKIIASSREALGINGETVYRVPSLSLPDLSKVTREAVMACESVQLFMERARAVNPNFILTDENASSVAQICRRLDGIPLAIELSASRIAVFSPEQIAARLDDRFKLLTGGSRTALPRQQTLRALIDWSYDMLSEEERALLRRLSVFVGGWTFEAAEAIYPNSDVLNLLTQLINKSMVVAENLSGEIRYSLLETIRQYARDKLLDAGEAERMRDRHLNIFVEFAEAMGPKLNDLEALEWLLHLDAEFDNFRSALEWGLERDIAAALRIILALNAFWVRRGHETEARHWSNEALTRLNALPKLEGEDARRQMKLVARTWETLTFLSFSQGDVRRAIEAADQCVILAQQLDDKRLLAIAFAYKATAKMVYLGIREDVEELVQESLRLARECGDQFALGLALALTGQAMAILNNDFKIARSYIEESNRLIGLDGNRWGTIMSILSLGMTAKLFGEYDEARLRFKTCLPLFRKIGDQHRYNMMKSELAHLERLEGHYEEAESAYRETILEWQRLGHRAAVANQLECFAFTSKAHEQNRRAAQLFGAAEALREQINIQMTMAERAGYEREVADLKANMDEREFTSFWAEGRSMTMDEAIELALQES